MVQPHGFRVDGDCVAKGQVAGNVAVMKSDVGLGHDKSVLG